MQDRRLREALSASAANVQRIVIASEAKQSRGKKSGILIEIAASLPRALRGGRTPRNDNGLGVSLPMLGCPALGLR